MSPIDKQSYPGNIIREVDTKTQNEIDLYKQETADMIKNAMKIAEKIREQCREMDQMIQRSANLRHLMRTSETLSSHPMMLPKNAVKPLDFGKRFSRSVETYIGNVFCEIHFSNGISRLRDADIILMGESHQNKKHRALENALINSLSNPGDFVLLEAVYQDETVNPKDLKADGEFFFDESVRIEGWENEALYVKHAKLVGEIHEYSLKAKNGETQTKTAESLKKGSNELCDQRSIQMVTKIRTAKVKAGRVFVIAGKNHLISKDKGCKFNVLSHLKEYKCAIISMEDDRKLSEKDCFEYTASFCK